MDSNMRNIIFKCNNMGIAFAMDRIRYRFCTKDF